MRFRRDDSGTGRVLMLLQNNPYPQDTRVWAEATTLQKHGYRVTVIAPKSDGQSRREIVEGVRVIRFAQREGRGSAFADVFEHVYGTIAIFFRSLRVLLTDGVDVVHAHNPPDTLLPAVSLFKLIGKRFVFDHHDLSPELYCARFDHPPRGVVYRALVLFERLSCRLADRVLAANESHRDVEIERAGVTDDRIKVLRNGPDTSWFTAGGATSENGSATIAYAGVMGPQDGLDVLVRAFARMRRTDAKLLMIGDGDARSEAESLAEALGVRDRIDFVGRVPRDDVIALLSGADVCVEPAPYSSYNDRSTMVKVMEYMALGKPVVAFSLRENRATGADALAYVQSGDEAAFAEAIDNLLNDPARRVMLGELGRARVETRLAWEHSAPALLDAYAELLTEDRPRGREAA